MTSPDLAFVVHGDPAPGGSKKGFVPRRKDGSIVTRANGAPIVNIVDDSKRNKSWRGKVMESVADQIGPPTSPADGYPLEGPVELTVVFTVPRPQTVPKRYGGRPIARPDVLKLLRSTEDALKDAGLLKDDAQVWRYRRLAKVYPDSDPMALPTPGAVIYLWRTGVTPAPAQPGQQSLALTFGTEGGRTAT